MENENLVAQVGVTIDAPAKEVWDALTDPDDIRKYMFGAQVSTDWKVGSPISWKGEWKGKQYEDKGRVLEVIPGELLQYSHYSPLSGAEDKPENYHTVTIRLDDKGDHTHVILSQDGNPTEETRDHSKKMWQQMLDSLKKMLEHMPD